jgi:hypothetical protein
MSAKITLADIVVEYEDALVEFYRADAQLRRAQIKVERVALDDDSLSQMYCIASTRAAIRYARKAGDK